jgi:hypothetical protein
MDLIPTKKKTVRLERLNAKLTDRPTRKFSDAEQKIIGRIGHDDVYVAQAVWALYSVQTVQEQVTRRTIQKNGVGFSASDARRCSKMADRVDLQGVIAAEDLAWCRRQLRSGIPYLAKYRGQLGRLLPLPEGPTPAAPIIGKPASVAVLPLINIEQQNVA